MRKYLSFIILLVASIALTACGGGGGGDTGGGVVSNDSFNANDIEDIETIPTLRQDTNAVKPSLTEAGDGNDFILQGLVVQGRQTENYTPGNDSFGWSRNSEIILDVARITFPAVSVNFNEDGQMLGMTAYFANQSYGSTIGRNTPLAQTRLDGTLSPSQDGTQDGTQTDIVDDTRIIVDRSSDFFGFANGKDANYMAHIGWYIERELSDYIDDETDDSDDDILSQSYVIRGSMIAGIETEADALPVSLAPIRFTGKGRGHYSYSDTLYNNTIIYNYATIFDVTADVDFTSQSVMVNSSGSKQCLISKSDCNLADDFESSEEIAIEFHTPVAIGYSINDDADDMRRANHIDIGGAVALVSDDSISGKLDARFYGGNARELGGTFAMFGGVNNSYYYGAFGAERGAIFTAFSGDYPYRR